MQNGLPPISVKLLIDSNNAAKLANNYDVLKAMIHP
jgi:hypothetical protein